MKDILFHKLECEVYKSKSNQQDFSELVVPRMISRVISRLSLDGGKPEKDLCSNVPQSIDRRSWSDLLGHRDEILNSSRHSKHWLTTKDQIEFYFGNHFNDFDLLEIFGKILINRFRVGIHQNILDGRVAIGWAIYLTTSCFNHSCQPDLLQCSFDINMRLKFVDVNQIVPQTSKQFNQLTLNYRHQNDFRLTNPFTYVPTRMQRRKFVSFFFFNCHCKLCADDLLNRYSESATNRLCVKCGDYLVLLNYFDDSILVCLGRKKCLNTERIVDHVNISMIDQTEQSIDIYQNKLDQIEQLLHPQSILLLQQREKLFFAYQTLINQTHSNQNQRSTFIHRAIQLGETLIQNYHLHLNHSAIYPKILLTDVAALCQSVGNEEKAKQFYQKAMDLWRSDYEDFIDYRDLNVLL
jgi:hypothetical protein